VLAAVDDEDTPDASSDALRNIVWYRNAMTDVRRLPPADAFALPLEPHEPVLDGSQ